MAFPRIMIAGRMVPCIAEYTASAGHNGHVDSRPRRTIHSLIHPYPGRSVTQRPRPPTCEPLPYSRPLNGQQSPYAAQLLMGTSCPHLLRPTTNYQRHLTSPLPSLDEVGSLCWGKERACCKLDVVCMKKCTTGMRVQNLGNNYFRCVIKCMQHNL